MKFHCQQPKPNDPNNNNKIKMALHKLNSLNNIIQHAKVVVGERNEKKKKNCSHSFRFGRYIRIKRIYESKQTNKFDRHSDVGKANP